MVVMVTGVTMIGLATVLAVVVLGPDHVSFATKLYAVVSSVWVCWSIGWLAGK